MLATAIIMFREVLEAALIIAIVLGASRGIVGHGRWVAAGVGMGLLGASIVAILAAEISSTFSGNGQAILDAGILLSAVAMLTWHNVWMSAHGRQLAARLSAVGADVQTGRRPLAALLVITLVAVMREGSEAVLFLWAIAAGGGQNVNMVLGGVGGVAAGVLVGFLLYRGLLRIPARHFFSITSWLILLLAAGLAAQAAGFLNQAGLLPALGNTVWNTSHILSQTSLTGQFLHILVGYVARPSGIQLVFYVGTLLTILLLMRSREWRRMTRVRAEEGTPGISD
ncbi:transport-related membrane protein [Sulfuriferula plumbiphila]|uniref:Transport-related membrane protein n=1 Tax=Sulfuriferula plumbiphila TaxID=171865 RepID=A0A512LCC7_9PROT|nr:FTR1 family protein [Sulfuriferula plumbiphila]BBP04778.1 transport-related membrane protein [Sulfuriferula plumbiphila]GEP32139.1 transport-related membrane protein [Sulfuriferula plumbiphila]